MIAWFVTTGLLAGAGLLVYGTHLLTQDQTGWRRWLPMLGRRCSPPRSPWARSWSPA